MSIGAAIGLGLVYLAAVAAYAKRQAGIAERILQDLSTRCPETWEEVGAPASVEASVKDPHRRWQRFIRERAYRSLGDSELVRRIDDFQRRNLVAMASLAVAGAAVLYCLWLAEAPAAQQPGSGSCFVADGRPCRELL